MSTELQVHPLVIDLFPPMDDAEFEALVADIKANGQHEPVTMFEDAILDGFHRYRACRQLSIEPNFTVYTGDDPVGFAVSLNLHRRQLNESQRAWVAAKLAKLAHGQRQSGQLAAVPTQGEAATMLNVGERSVRRAREVLDHGAPELAQAVERGDVSVSAAAEVASLPESEQREVLADGGAKAVAAKAKELREERAGAAAERKWDTPDTDDDDEPDDDEADAEPEEEAEDADDETRDLTLDEIEAAADAEPPNWKYWTRIFTKERAKRIRGTCLNKTGEVRALYSLGWGAADELIAAAERGETVSAAAIWEGQKTEARDFANKLIDRDLDDARRLYDILVGNGDAHICNVFINALGDTIGKLDGVPVEEDYDDEVAA